MNAASLESPLSIAITTGEPAGVGPELTVAAQDEFVSPTRVFGAWAV